jgi:ammonium transporter Rh
MALTKLEKLLFPGTLLLFELIFFVIYGLLVDYSDGGSPDHEYQTALDLANNSNGEIDTARARDYLLHLESTRSTTKVYPFFQDVHVMVFIGFGFLMTFLRRYSFGSVGFNMLLASFAIQWSTITLGLLELIDLALKAKPLRISLSLESLVYSDFAAAAVLITFGSMLGRASPFQMFAVAFFEIIFYSLNDAVNIYVYQAADVGGSMLIHTFGAYFGLACSFILYRKSANNHSHNSSTYHSDVFAMIGTLFLWLFWPSFNGALASGNGQYRAIINTYFSMTGSVIATFIFSVVFSGKRKLDMVHVQNATLAGGVAVGSIADMLIGPWAGMFIGFLAGLISVAGYRFLSPIIERWFYLQDTCGVHNLHGLPGILSAVASIVAAGVATNIDAINGVNYGTSLFLVFPARAPVNLTSQEILLNISPGENRSAGAQAGFQLALLITTLFVSIIGGIITGVIVNFCPVFQRVGDDGLFDDDLYWKLPDDAHNYLPVSVNDESEDDNTEGSRRVPLQAKVDWPEMKSLEDERQETTPPVKLKGVKVLPEGIELTPISGGGTEEDDSLKVTNV